MNRRRFDAEQFISNVFQINTNMLEFDQKLWMSLVEVVVVPPSEEKHVAFWLRNGQERMVCR